MFRHTQEISLVSSNTKISIKYKWIIHIGIYNNTVPIEMKVLAKIPQMSVDIDSVRIKQIELT